MKTVCSGINKYFCQYLIIAVSEDFIKFLIPLRKISQRRDQLKNKTSPLQKGLNRIGISTRVKYNRVLGIVEVL